MRGGGIGFNTFSSVRVQGRVGHTPILTALTFINMTGRLRSIDIDQYGVPMSPVRESR